MKGGGEETKEFLGGPSEDEWKYWHYAVLIKISESDKRNLPQGACLEFSGTTLKFRIAHAPFMNEFLEILLHVNVYYVLPSGRKFSYLKF